MNKAQLVKSIAKKAGLPLNKAEKALNGLLETVTQSLKKGEKVALIGFGTWGSKKRPARTGRNPQTGKPMKIPARKVAFFKVGSKLKDAVKGGK